MALKDLQERDGDRDRKIMERGSRGRGGNRRIRSREQRIYRRAKYEFYSSPFNRRSESVKWKCAAVGF
ncbi:conserved hypothetical protein [Ricinus communis]|uniref:Uncharacterized protein n=1 Tax=Ricinus communis TaxID=3988 RepID=B9RP44_RICCO|nr:conserved hypothetical protein [Ricinus communis]